MKKNLLAVMQAETAEGTAVTGRPAAASPSMKKSTSHLLKPNKHEMKTRETRELLLQAAQEIFVRDGYERAELGEIARRAGRTKGSIYAQFKSKEEIFLALVEQHALRSRGVTQKRLASSQSIEGNFAAFRETFLEAARDEAWGLLLLEFRLYAIRHPDAKERLRKTYEAILPRTEEATYARLLGPAAKGKRTISRMAAVHAGFAMLSALQLEAKFNPDVVTPDSIERMANKIFDALLDFTLDTTARDLASASARKRKPT